MHDHTSKPAGTLHSHQTKATLTSNIGALQHDERTRSHKKKHALTKTNSTLLLKLLAAFCVLDSVGAAAVGPAEPPSTSPTCGCSEEVAAMQEKIDAMELALRHEFYEQLQDVRQCSGCMSPSPPPPSPWNTACEVITHYCSDLSTIVPVSSPVTVSLLLTLYI